MTLFTWLNIWSTMFVCCFFFLIHNPIIIQNQMSAIVQPCLRTCHCSFVNKGSELLFFLSQADWTNISQRLYYHFQICWLCPFTELHIFYNVTCISNILFVNLRKKKIFNVSFVFFYIANIQPYTPYARFVYIRSTSNAQI